MLIITLFTSFIIISLDIPHFNCCYCAKLLVSMTFENSVWNGRGWMVVRFIDWWTCSIPKSRVKLGLKVKRFSSTIILKSIGVRKP